MSVYTQEVLGLLNRNKKKIKLDKIKDHFEFGKLYRNSSLNTGSTYNPTMEPFVIKWGDFKCATEEGMVRQDPTGTQERYITMWTDPVFQGDCNTATITKTIISQNDLGTIINIAGDTVIEGDLQVDQNANINLQLTAGSANILDLTEDRIVIVGPNGELEDDANLTFDGTEFNIGQGNFTVQVNTGNTQIIGTLDVDDQATLASANVEDLTNDRIVIVGVDGELEDDANFTMDGTTFTANVNVIHGTDVPAGVPTHTTTINSNLKLEGPVYDSLGSVGGLNKVLVGLADGRVKWQDDDLVEALTYGSLWQGDPTNYKVELPIGTADQILISDGTTFSWEDNPAAIVGEQCEVYRLPLWTPDSNTLGCSILIQDGNSTTPATKVTIEGEAIVEGDLHVETNTFLEGNVEVNGTTKLDTLDQDDTLIQVLVRDTTNDNLIKFRDASSIKPQVGFDTLAMLPDGWASAQGNFNAVVALDDTTTAVKSIKDMDWLVDGDRVVVIAANVKTGSLLADNVIQFPTWNSSNFTSVSNHTSWNQSSIGTGWTGAINNGYQTSTLLFGEKIKFKAELYEIPTTGTAQLNWDACCKIYSENTCPLVNNASFTVDEDAFYNGTLITSDDGYGGYGYTFTIVSQPTNGTITNFDSATGTYTYTPNPNYNGFDSFTYQANDGYCDSNVANVNITVNSINDAPVWISIDPTDPTYTGTPWTNLTGGDVLVPYNWTVADPDHPCSDLTYNMTLVDSNGTPGTWLTFTPNTPADCGGTLSGTYPVTGGIWTVILTVSDPGGLSATQEFTISGIIPDKDTYFAIWIDNSGSMSTLAQELARQVSIGQAIAQVTGISANTITVSSGGVQVTDSVFINDINALVAGTAGVGGTANYMVPSTLPAGVTTSFSIDIINTNNGNLTNTGINITTQNTPGSNTLLCDANPTGTIQAGDYILLTISDALASSDYNNQDSLRSLFQDFYATGGVEGAPDFNTNPTTNGRDRYTSHFKFGFMNQGPGNGENWFYGLANYGYQDTQTEFDTTVSTNGIFQDATTICTLVFGDEASGSYDVGGGPYSGTGTAGGASLLTDLNSTRTWISLGPNASIDGVPTSVNAVGCMFAAATAATIRNIGVSAGARNGVGSGDVGAGQTFGGNWSNSTAATLLPIEPTPPTPRRIEFSGYNGDPTFGTGGIPQSSPSSGFYQNLIRTKLQNLGFQNI
jgi:hypothetical protein